MSHPAFLVAPIGEAERLALVSLILSMTRRPDCAAILDVAASEASTADRRVAEAVGLAEPVSIRFGAARVLNSLCAACGSCARGRQTDEARTFMAPHP